MDKLSHRERVLLALDHQDTDRVPMDLCASTCNMVDPLYFKVRDALNIQGDIPPYRSGRTSSYYDERILNAFDIDFRHISLKSPKSHIIQIDPDGYYRDEWGVKMRLYGGEVICAESPLADAEDVDDILAYDHWPDLTDRSRVEGLRERAQYLREKTDFAVSAKFVTSFGFLEHGGYLRGFQNWLCDLVSDPEISEAIMDKIMEVKIALYTMMLEEIGDYVDIVELSEDFGTQTSLFISRETFRKYMFPRSKKIIACIREHAPHAKIFFHTCGAVYPLIGDMIEMGVDILNPLQPLAAGMDSAKIKDNFGDKLCFHGAIDIQKAMPGSIEDVRREVETRIDALYHSGGYILAPANHLQKDTPVENVIELFRYASEYSSRKNH